MSEIAEICAKPVATENGAKCDNLANGSGGVDIMEVFIESLRPLLSMPDDRKETSIDKLRSVLAERVAEDPKFKERKFYQALFEELLHVIEARNYSNANTLLKEAIEELKYNVDVKPKLDNQKELKLRTKRIKSLKLKLWRLHKKAQRYLEKEVDINADGFEEADTAFIKQQRISRKIITIKRQINELQNKPLRTGSSNEKKYTFNASEYREINEALTKLVNDNLVESHKAKSEEKLRLLAAPDLATIHQVIVKVAESNHLCLYDIEEYSKKMLRKLGEDLKDRRRMESEFSFESYLRLDTIKPETVIAAEDELQLEPKFKEHGEKAILDTECIIRQFEEQENASEMQVENGQEVNSEEVKDDEAKDEEVDDETSSSELESDDEKENEEESSDDEEIMEDSDDDVQIVEVKGDSNVQSADV